MRIGANKLRVGLVFVAAAFVGGHALAHSSPLEAIARITDEIEAQGASARLLVQRAIEYRTLSDYPAARNDLEQALRLEPANFMALRELAQVDLRTGAFDASLRAIDRSLAKADAPIARWGMYALRAQVLGSAGRTDEALDDIARALEAARPEVDWYLQRSRLQWTAERFDDRVRDLRVAASRNPSIVIQYELTDALIDAEYYEESLDRVETELAKCRDCASWLLRRARIRLGMGDDEIAKADLESAIAALTQRLNDRRYSTLDVTLIVERATAYALVGNRARAERGLHFAEALEADEWLTAPLARLLDTQDPTAD